MLFNIKIMLIEKFTLLKYYKINKKLLNIFWFFQIKGP